MSDKINRKVLILGLDGATWKILKPLINLKVLPNIRKIVNNGCTGTLESTIPPITSPAWPCIATGMNPSKLGVYSTFRRVAINDFKLKPVTSTVYKGKAFWDVLSWYGYRVALIKIPFLYPIYKVNGCMISGFGTIGKFSIYPEHLHEKVKHGADKLLETKIFNELYYLRLDDHKECLRYVSRCRELVLRDLKVVTDIAKSIPWNVFFYVVSQTDWLQHAFMDRILALITKLTTKKYKTLDALDQEILRFYKVIDLAVKNFLNILEKENSEWILFIISDHGFTVSNYTFNIAKWLVSKGYMKLRRPRNQKRSMLLKTVLNFIKKTFIFISFPHSSIPMRLTSLAFRLAHKLASEAVLGISQLVDFKNSKVFCLEDSALYVNKSISSNNRDILTRLLIDLKRTLEDRYRLNIKFFKIKEIYKGAKSELAPDLIIDISDNDHTWGKTTDLNKPLISPSKLPGVHDRYGTFIAYGTCIKEGYVMKNLVKIFDIAPTVLHIFEVPIPANIDGIVLREIFKEDSPLAKRFPSKESVKTSLKRMISFKFKRLNI